MRRRLSSFPVLLTVAVVVAAGLGGGLALLSAGDGPSEPPALRLPEQPAATDPEGQAAQPDEAPSGRRPARQVFGHTCGTCHTLRDAGTTARVGPDLDALKPSAAQVRRVVRTGSIDGVMQPNLLRGAQARSVAAYVARAAGSG